MKPNKDSEPSNPVMETFYRRFMLNKEQPCYRDQTITGYALLPERKGIRGNSLCMHSIPFPSQDLQSAIRKVTLQHPTGRFSELIYSAPGEEPLAWKRVALLRPGYSLAPSSPSVKRPGLLQKTGESILEDAVSHMRQYATSVKKSQLHRGDLHPRRTMVVPDSQDVLVVASLKNAHGSKFGLSKGSSMAISPRGDGKGPVRHNHNRLNKLDELDSIRGSCKHFLEGTINPDLNRIESACKGELLPYCFLRYIGMVENK